MSEAKITCPKCGCQNVFVQAVTETKIKQRGCFRWFLWILLVICTFGLLIIIPLMTNSKTKSKTHTEAVCQNCGYRWKL